MPITTLSSRELHQNAGKAKRAAKKGPVFITDRGRPSFVLLNIDEYTKMSGPCRSIGDLLSDPAAAEIEFDPPRLGFIAREVDLS
jgi:prevent-host-death family protein